MKMIIALLLSFPLFAQSDRPSVSNAQSKAVAYGGDLKRQLTSNSAAWFGYAVKTRKEDHQACCWGDGRQQGCSLEGDKKVVNRVAPTSPVLLEGTEKVAVLFRIDATGVKKVRIFPMDCPLDADGLSFEWIEQVPDSASLSYLDDVLHETNDQHVMEGAIVAVAQHESHDADRLLEKLTQSSQPEKIREQAIFWLGAARGSNGLATLKSLVVSDPSEHIREKAVFALYVGKRQEALNTIIEVAKSDRSPHIRSQALFWLAQSAGQRAASAIVDAVQNDPDTEVKERAVFALSQLPKDEGVPKLIQVATDQRNTEVKKKAFFWLGQSRDPRALAFIEKVLTN